MTGADLPTCFVVTGFGQKTDYPTGRVLNLDLTFSKLVRPACDVAGINAFRAIDANVTGSIDLIMYRWIFAADYVIADLSTLNANVFYELGVRHAQRPNRTLIIAEEMLMTRVPFDLSSFVVHQYRHDGDKITQAEQDRFVPFLADLLHKMQAGVARERSQTPPVPDSPIYTFLEGMVPPDYQPKAALAAPVYVPLDGRATAIAGDGATIFDLMKAAETARKKNDFDLMISYLTKTIEMERGGDDSAKPDLFLMQQLVLATYKAGEQQDDPEAAIDALVRAETMLEQHCAPWLSTDPETLGLLGAINKRMYDHTGELDYLDRALHAYERGFFIKQDYYNGINAAFMYTLRAGIVSDRFEAIASYGQANMLRRRVITICKELLGALDGSAGPEDREWVYATLAEAAYGLGDMNEQRRLERWLNAEASEFARSSYYQQKTRLTEAIETFGKTDLPLARQGHPQVITDPANSYSIKTEAAEPDGAITIIPKIEPGRKARSVEISYRIEYND
ncbi:tetratricopeptide repeat-containing protein [Loktanella agnita]|uniref:tetratricopeptide repeat-containing protein n=1 Tax=Loktanella agnita TaxID=287097 RepID=UPI0039886FC8